MAKFSENRHISCVIIMSCKVMMVVLIPRRGFAFDHSDIENIDNVLLDCTKQS